MATKGPQKAESAQKEIQTLRRELAQLQKRMTKLEAQLSKSQKTKKITASKLSASSIEITDPDGKVVASIDNKGNLFCLTVWASTGKNTRGVFIDGKTFRKISANALELIGPKGNKPGLSAMNWPSGVVMHFLDPQTQQRLSLQSSGAPLLAYDKAGKLAATLRVNSPVGGGLQLSSTETGSKAEATISISHLTSAGSVFLTDSNGKVVGKLP
jgi:hypothetical protein